MSEVEPQKVRKITLGLIISWLVGLMLLIMGAANLASHVGSGIMFLIAALITLPPLSKLMAEKLKLSLSGTLKFILVIVLFGFGTGLSMGGDKNEVGAPTQNNNQVTAPQEQAIPVTATKLMTGYEANEVAADATYKGKLVEITGTISNIGKDILDTPYVAFSAGANTFFSVQCMFEKSDQSQLASLVKDTRITLRGRVSGKLGNILVNDCSIVH